MVLGDTAGTGFGTVTADLGRALIALGVDVRFASLNEQPGGELAEPFAGRTAVVGGPDGWLSVPPLPPPLSEDASEDEIAAYRAAVVEWGLRKQRIDTWATGGMFPDGWPPEAALIIGDPGSVKVSPFVNTIPPGFPVYHYVPVEGVGLPPLWANLWGPLRPVAMSEFGADQIESLGVPRPPVVYHGVSLSDFYPVTADRMIDVYGWEGASPESVKVGRDLRVRALKDGRKAGWREGILRSRDDCKRFLGLDPKRFLLYRADRHVPRKNYASLLRAVAPVMAKHSEVDLLIHCRTIDQGGDLDDERSKYGPLMGWEPCGKDRCSRGGMHPIFGGVANRMVTTGLHDHFGGADRRMLNILYNAADVYVSVSAEGFGLTIAEAIACGVPAVGIDYSAVPEVIGPAGIVVPPRGLVDNIYSHFWALVDEVAFGAAVESLILSRGRRRDLGRAGPRHVSQNFTWEVAARGMLAAIEAREVEAA